MGTCISTRTHRTRAFLAPRPRRAAHARRSRAREALERRGCDRSRVPIAALALARARAPDGAARCAARRGARAMDGQTTHACARALCAGVHAAHRARLARTARTMTTNPARVVVDGDAQVSLAIRCTSAALLVVSKSRGERRESTCFIRLCARSRRVVVVRRVRGRLSSLGEGLC